MKYRYKAKTQKGKTFSGVIEATSSELVMEMLHRRNLIVTEMEEIEKVSIYKKEIKILPERVKPKDLVFLFKQLSSLFSANVPLVEAITAVGKQSSSNFLRQILAEMTSDVDGGMAFSEALSRHPKAFSAFVENMVKTGEAIGNLERVLEYLSAHVERSYALTAKIKGAMYYPAFILGAIGVVVVIMLVFVMPQMSGMFAEFGVDLPLPTKVLVALSDFFVNYGWILFLGLFALGIFIWKYVKTPTGRRIKSKIEIKLPIIGLLFQNIYLSQLAENLGTLIKGGLPIVQSLGIVAEVVGNTLYKDTIRNCQNAVRRGETIASTFSESEIIPPVFSQMVSAGEKSGKTQDVLIDLAKFYNEEVDTMISNLMSLLEPVLIVIMGIMVGFIAAAVLLPVYQLSGSI